MPKKFCHILMCFVSLVTSAYSQQDSTELISIKLIESNMDTLVGGDFIVQYPNFPGESY